MSRAKQIKNINLRDQILTSIKGFFINVFIISTSAGFIGLGVIYSPLTEIFPGIIPLAQKMAVLGFSVTGLGITLALAILMRKVKSSGAPQKQISKSFSLWELIKKFITRTRGNQNIMPVFKSSLAKGLPALNLLPLPPAGEAVVLDSRTGSGFARRINMAFRRVGLVDEGQKITVIKHEAGPVASRVTFGLPVGLRLTRVQNMTRDLTAAFGVTSLQVTTASKAGAAALVISHNKRLQVYLRPVLETMEFRELFQKAELPLVIGVDDVGSPVLSDLVRIRHLLIAGATGAGKSWFINMLLVTLIMCKSPGELKFILIDPKKVELRPYHDMPHTLLVATEVADAVNALKYLVNEMDRRYKIFEAAGAKNIQHYRDKSAGRGDPLPYIVCVVDELADLMVQAKKEVEPLIQRLAQLARASGIHMLVATQRPSVNVITGVIKANLPSRIAFRMVSEHDYRTALDHDPKIALGGDGDGLALLEGTNGLQRIQSPGVGGNEQEGDEVLERLAGFWAEAKGFGKKDTDKVMQIRDLADKVNLTENQSGKMCTPVPKNLEAGVDVNPHMVALPGFPDENDENMGYNDSAQLSLLPEDEDDNMLKLKRLLAESVMEAVENDEDLSELKAPSSRLLRTYLGVKNATLFELIQRLVNQGWLEPPDTPRTPNKITVSPETAREYFLTNS